MGKKGSIDLELSASAVDADEKAAAQGKALPQQHAVKGNKSGAAIYTGGAKGAAVNAGKKSATAEISDSELSDGDD